MGCGATNTSRCAASLLPTSPWSRPLSGQEIVELVKAARMGEPLAIQTLYERFARAVHGCLLSYVSHSDAEDLVQDVFETVLRRLDKLREPAAFPGWLIATTRNVALQHLRQRGRCDLELHDVVGGGVGPDQSAEVRHVLAALSGTPPSTVRCS